MTSRPTRRVGVLWPRLGPYHLARLRAAHAAFAAHGVELVALETAGNDATYAWAVEDTPEAFERYQVFPNRVYDQIPPSEMQRGVSELLIRLGLDGVAITSYSTPDAQAALTWCRRHRRTAVCMLATKADDADRQWLRERMKAQIVEQFDAALVGGAPQRRYLESLGMPSERIFVPYNAVDNSYFERRAYEICSAGPPRSLLPGLEDTRPFFVTVNRFIAIKNLSTLIDAYAIYRSNTTNNPWRLVLVGDGPERASLEALARSNDIPDVTFAGFQQVDTLPEYYARAGAFVHPAHLEPWGLVLNEAMASGLPVIVSERMGAAEDLVTSGWNGFVFDPTRADDLAECLSRVHRLTTPERTAMIENGRQRVAGWSPERFAEGLWKAFIAGQEYSDRPLGIFASGLLAAQRLFARRIDSFHAR